MTMWWTCVVRVCVRVVHACSLRSPRLLSGWQVDEDGDAVVPRRPTGKVPHHDGGTVTIAHHLATPLADVGLQVWRGALLLADYAIHHQVRLCG